MNVAILSVASKPGGFGWVLEIDKYETGTASVISRHGANSHGVLEFLVYDYVVGTTKRQVLEMTCQVVDREGNGGLFGINGEELVQC